MRIFRAHAAATREECHAYYYVKEMAHFLLVSDAIDTINAA